MIYRAFRILADIRRVLLESSDEDSKSILSQYESEKDPDKKRNLLLSFFRAKRDKQILSRRLKYENTREQRISGGLPCVDGKRTVYDKAERKSDPYIRAASSMTDRSYALKRKLKREQRKQKVRSKRRKLSLKHQRGD